MFTTKSGPRDTVSFSDLTRAVGASRVWKGIRLAVTADLRAAGLLDADRERTRTRMTLLGVGLVIAGIAGLAACVPLLERVGDAVLVLPVAMQVAGAVGIASGATLNVMSVEGQRRRRAAKSYQRYLTDVSKQASGASATSAVFDQALPYAAAFGLAVSWAKHLEKQGVTTGPSWLGTLARDLTRSQSHMAATIAMLSAGSHAGGQAGGHGVAGGAGAAGGGASGAG